MNALTEMLTQQLSGSAISLISSKIGADSGTTSKALSLAVPLLISALARNSSTPAGAQALNQAIAKDHDGSILNDVAGFLGGGQSADGAGILGHVFGDRRGSVENGLAQSTGLDPSAAGSLLETVAPLVMGALGKTQKEQGLDADSLSAFLGGQHQQAQQTSPDLMGMLGGLLDSNKDGSVLDDVTRIAGKFFGS
ncbi:MAG TPA: DUF937 domain-containing protein [Blastocatellia bacterium]|nr:DUF937 domain-containing protein [Blastocatellia bacterium]